MRDSFLPFCRPSISSEDAAAVAEVLCSGWITTGPKTAEFEDRFAELVGCRGAAAVSSATAGMHITLRALDIGPGDEVITPSLTWVSTVNMIVLAGAKPVFVDVDRDTLMAPPEAFEAALTNRTRAIIPVHFAGAAADVEPMYEMAESRGFAVIEDAAHAVGTRYRGGHVGARGTSIFSFHPIKNITTAEGGMICSNDDALLERVRRLRFHGLGADAFDRNRHGRAPQAEVLEPGFKYNLPDALAVLGLRQLNRLGEFNSKRATLAARYLDGLADMPAILPLAAPSYPSEHAWQLFIVRLDTDRLGMDRAGFMEALRSRNVGTGIHFRAVHTQRWYRENVAIPPGSLPATEWNSERVFSIPLFPDMTTADVEDVLAAIEEILTQGGVAR
jgi:UDP-4-amino-4-deoxy-L-arabinose-oxoglutarate aminotransferase